MVKQWVIVGPSAWPDTPQWQTQLKDTRVLALDGAYLLLERAGVNVDVVLGDFDSLPSATLRALREGSDTVVVPAPDQADTDAAKGLMYVIEQGATDITMIGLWGDRIDHSWHNLQLLRQYHQRECELRLLSASEQVIYIQDATLCLSGSRGDRVALLGAAGPASVTSAGLTFDMDQWRLGREGKDSIANSMASPLAEITVTGGAFVVMAAAVEWKRTDETE